MLELGLVVVAAAIVVFALQRPNDGHSSSVTASATPHVNTGSLEGSAVPPGPVFSPTPHPVSPRAQTGRTVSHGDRSFKVKRLSVAVVADNVSDNELSAVAGFVGPDLQTLPREPGPSQKELAAGRVLFEAHCSSCHSGDPAKSFLFGEPRDWDNTLRRVALEAFLQRVKATSCEWKARDLDDTEVFYLASYTNGLMTEYFESEPAKR